jgi:hypothetical protein
MPKLYLELIENKDKIKQDLVNKEYIPSRQALEYEKPIQVPLSTRLDELLDHYPASSSDESVASVKVRSEFYDDEDEDDDVMSDHEKKESYRPRPLLELSDRSSEDDEDNDYSTHRSDEQSLSDSSSHTRSRFQKRKVSPVESSRESTSTKGSTRYGRNSYDRQSLNDASSAAHYSPRYDTRRRPPVEKNDVRKYDDTPYSRYDSAPQLPPQTDFARYDSPVDNIRSHFDYSSRNTFEQPKSNALPSLHDLEMQGTYKKTIPNLDYMETDVEEMDTKRELLFKFDMLRKSYKDTTVSIPEFTMHSNYKEMKKSYDMTVRQLSIDSSVESYKTYLIGGFLLVEYLFGNWLGFDMQGFTQQQILSMSSYERLLLELGEKSYVEEESQWPVEVRLIGLVVVNAAFFVISKMIMQKTGSNVLNMINNMNNMSGRVKKAKRKMRGPDINLDDLPEL